MTRPEDKAGDCSGYLRCVRSDKVRTAAVAPIAKPAAKSQEEIDAEDAKVSIWSASAILAAAVALMGASFVGKWAKRLIGRRS